MYYSSKQIGTAHVDSIVDLPTPYLTAVGACGPNPPKKSSKAPKFISQTDY